ncbi:hypothetical protein LWI28_007287 [Acer negundo]|uniref:Uncharacterized protein n=1 Tax=Acer negundo TaxID=4023 RepID=A0AAD5I9G8_ACENE|nr:hypothetical protein LWI28_007287 [Acer negundo]
MPKQGASTCLNAKSFIGMKNLMLLKINNVDLYEDLEYLPNKLRYLKWHGCPSKTLPPNFRAQKLLELNLCYSQINYLWTGKKAFKELTTIKLSHSCNLIETPDFTEVPNLEMLDLEACGVFAPDPGPYPVDLDDDDNWMLFLMSLISNEYEFSFQIPHGFRTVKSDLLWLTYVSRLRFEHDYSFKPKVTYYDTSSDIAPVSGSTCIHATFRSKSKVIKCGIRLVYKQDLEDFQELPTAEGSTIHQNHKCSLLRKRFNFLRPASKLQSYRWITNHLQELGGDYLDRLPELGRDYLDILFTNTEKYVFFRSNKHEITFDDDIDRPPH